MTSDDNRDDDAKDHEFVEIRPNPDPTTLTTKQLFREIGTLKELIDARFVNITNKFDVVRAAAEEVKRDLKSTRSFVGFSVISLAAIIAVSLVTLAFVATLWKF